MTRPAGVLAVSALALLAAGCGDDASSDGSDAAPDAAGDTASADSGVIDQDSGGGGSTDGGSGDGGAADIGGADAVPSDAGGTDDADPADANPPDAGPEDADPGEDAVSPEDAGLDAGADTGILCEPGGRLICDDPCVFSFTSLDEDREGLRVVTVRAEGGGPLSITGLAFEETSPLARFSSGWLRYVDRITDGAWESPDDGASLDTGDFALRLPEGALELEVRFEAPDGDPTAGCPSGRRDRCGELVVEWRGCDGVSGAPVRVPIRR